MMKTSFLSSRHLVVVLMALSVLACKRTMVAKKMTKTMAAFVYAYTSGTISRETPVRVRLTSGIVKPEEVGKNVENGIFSLTPSVSGTAIWEDPQTIRFTPEKEFASGQTYVASVQLRKVFKNVPADAEVFEFDFRTRELYYEVVVDGIQAENQNDMTNQNLVGDLTTSDRTDDKAVEKVLTAKQNGNSLKINWLHAPDGQHHTFKIKEVKRGDGESKVNLAWEGSALSVDINGGQEVIIPSLSDFKAMNARLVQDAEQYVKVNFSDPLSNSQDLSGLIKVPDWYGALRYAVDGNAVLIYPNERITGDRVVAIDAGVSNFKGTKMKAPANFSLSFADVKPQVRLVGRGVIMPNNDGLNFPFEAVNLNYVDVEVVKIFNNNILQFLQTNDLDGENDMERVGRIEMQKRVSLKDLNPSGSTMKWTRYGLNLSEIIKKDPTAIYQIRLGFRKNYSNFSCGGAAQKDELNGMTLAAGGGFEANKNNDNEGDGRDNWQNENSIWRENWNGGESNEYSDYQQRENPCSVGYYNNEHFVKRNVFASDLGIIAKKGGDNSIFVAVSDLKTTAPKANVKLDFYDYQNQILASVTTNSEGTAIAKELKGKPWMVVATTGNEKGYLPLSNNNALNLSRFDVGGNVAQKGLKGFIYGERGVWRPGDSIHLNFILEDKEHKLPEDYPVTVEFFDPKNTLQYRATSIENVHNIYPFNLATRPEAPTGTWRVAVKAGGATFNENLKIETVKPNRMKINLDFGKKEIGAGEENLDGKMQVNWLHGAPARNVRVKIEATMASIKTEFPKFKDFEFDNPVKSFKSDPSVLFEGNVDDNGFANVKGNLPKADNAAGKMRVGLRIRAFEPSGDFSSDYVSLDYAPFKTFTGVFIPKNQGGEKRIDKNKDGKVTVCVVDKNGTPLRNRVVDVTLYKVEWRWWWDNNQGDDEAKFTSGKNMKSIFTKKVTTNSDGTADVDVKVTEWGRYFVYAGDPLSNHFTGDYFYAGYPWEDNENAGMSRNDAAMLNFKTNKTKYSTGEMVELNIPTPEGGKALISIENGSKVIESKWINTVKGATKYSFRATSDMAPTVFAFVTLVQPHNTDKNDLPIRMYGVTPVNVEDPKTKLEPIVKAPDVMKPEETVTIDVREKNGKPMAYTIAMVDEGLLDLTRFNTPSPWESFYAREALGVQTFDVYDQVLGAYGGQLQKILNIGGDKAAKQKNAQRADRFKPVVVTLGPFYNKGGTDHRKIKIPNYVGSVRTMVVAADNGAYGSGETTTPVRKALMVLPTLPRVLSQNEVLKLPVSVFAMENKVKSATVTISETSGLVQIIGNRSQTVSFDKPSDKMLEFDLKVTEGVGVAKFHVVAEGGGETTTSDIEIDVRNPNPFVTDIKQGIVQAGESFNTSFNSVGNPSNCKVTLEVSTIPPIDLASRLQYLLKYPYGCVEQTTSTIFPQLYVDKLMNLSDEGKKLAASNVRAGIEKLKQFQTSNGGFGYWQGEEYADAWASNYVGHFLVEAKNMGFALPPNMLERLVKVQQQEAKRWTASGMTEGWSRESHDLNQAYRLYFLAAAKQPEVGAMNSLREKKDLSNSARWTLASAYSMTSKPEVAKQLIASANTTVPKYREWSYTFGSDLRDQAMMLETLVLMKDNAKAYEMAKEVSQKLSSGDWYGTQSVAYGLLSMARFAGNAKAGENFTFNYNINGKSGNFTSKSPIAQIEMDKTTGSQVAANNSIVLKNTSKNQLFIRVILRGQPNVGQVNEQAMASNLNLNIQYKTVKGEAIDVRNLKQGTDFVAEVTVTNTGTLGKNYKEMALNQVFPSGWEIHNTRMEKVQGYTNTSVPRFQDIRDDRVNTFFDLPSGKSHTFRVQLNAAYSGRYYLPTQLCEAMYDNSIMAKIPGMWVEIMKGDKGNM